MEFILKDAEGNEIGPVGKKEVEQWILQGYINAESPIRNSMIKKWNQIGNISLFAEALQQYQASLPEEDRTQVTEKKSNMYTVSETSFKNTVVPVPAGFLLRTLAACLDWVLILLFAILLCLVSYVFIYFQALNDTADKPAGYKEKKESQENAQLLPEPEKLVKQEKPAKNTKTSTKAATLSAKTDKPKELPPEEKIKIINNTSSNRAPTSIDNLTKGFAFGTLWVDNSTNTKYSCVSSSKSSALWIKSTVIGEYLSWCYIGTALAAVLYFCLGLGIFAQTVGMWFWGIFLEKYDFKEAYMFRALCFSLLILPFGLLTIFSIFFRGRAVHDLITGVRIERISGKRV